MYKFITFYVFLVKTAYTGHACLFNIYSELLLQVLQAVLLVKDIFGYIDDVMAVCNSLNEVELRVRIYKKCPQKGNVNILSSKLAVLECIQEKNLASFCTARI